MNNNTVGVSELTAARNLVEGKRFKVEGENRSKNESFADFRSRWNAAEKLVERATIDAMKDATLNYKGRPSYISALKHSAVASCLPPEGTLLAMSMEAERVRLSQAVLEAYATRSTFAGIQEKALLALVVHHSLVPVSAATPTESGKVKWKKTDVQAWLLSWEAGVEVARVMAEKAEEERLEVEEAQRQAQEKYDEIVRMTEEDRLKQVFTDSEDVATKKKGKKAA